MLRWRCCVRDVWNAVVCTQASRTRRATSAAIRAPRASRLAVRRVSWLCRVCGVAGGGSAVPACPRVNKTDTCVCFVCRALVSKSRTIVYVCTRCRTCCRVALHTHTHTHTHSTPSCHLTLNFDPRVLFPPPPPPPVFCAYLLLLSSARTPRYPLLPGHSLLGQVDLAATEILESRSGRG